jgi:hypothetical protein
VPVTVTLETAQFTLTYQPGSLTVQTHVETPIPQVLLQPDSLSVNANLNEEFRPEIIPVLVDINPPIPHLIWSPTTLDVPVTVHSPTIDIQEGNSEWYFKMISAGGQ